MVMKNTTSARLFFTILLISTLFFISARGIINNRITRAFDMDGPNSKQVTLIEFTNDSNEDIETYTLLVNSNHFNNLVYIEAKMNDEKLEVKRSIVDDVLSPHHSSYKVKFKNPISRGSKGKMIVLELYKNRKLPFPRTMKLTDIPKVRLIDNAYYPSMYPTEKMKSTFELGTTSILIKATEDGIGEVRGRSVRYGTFKDVAPLKSHQIVVYMSYDEPLPIFTSMTRSVFLSHWGPVSIEEEYRLINKIADLEGEFGRLNFHETKTKFSINNLDCELPKDTFDLYYTDEIGNITTSNAYRSSNSVKFIIEPRFPVLGGWKTYWKQGYSLPKEHYITQDTQDNEKFTATFTVSHPYDEIVAEDFTLKIVLPEGASEVKLDLPFEVDSVHNESTYRYLDMEGSKVLVIKKRNVIEKYHNLEVTVTYKLTSYYMYFKPSLLALYGLCIVAFSTLFYKYS